MSRIVEHVERAVYGDCAGYSYKPEAVAAARATLQHVRDNISRDMILAARRVKHLRIPKRSAEEVMFSAMLEACLAEIEGGTGQ